MARPQKNRNVSNPPQMKGFKPYGISCCKIEVLQLTYEEYESFRLVSYEMFSQEEAAKKMNISRPTLTRIYNKAIKTLARAFVEGKAIEIRGGNYILEKEWFRCKKCHKLIQGIENHEKCLKCTEWQESELIKLNN